MPDEIEAKVRLADPEAMRRRMESLAGPGAGPVLEVNRLFDDARRSLSTAGAALRLREERPAAGPSAGSVRQAHGLSESKAGQAVVRTLLTYKGPRQAGRIKRRPEFQTSVAEAEAMVAILGGMGFAEVFRYEKRRTTWHVGACEVVLDELPRLGWFAEVEGPSEEAVLRCLAEVGLAAEPIVRDTYVGLLVADLSARGLDPTRAVF